VSRVVRSTALERFQEAFERLKNDCPQVLPKGSPVNQSTVAQEAGCIPSALRKSRFSALIADIKNFASSPDNEAKPITSRAATCDSRDKEIADLKRTRDELMRNLLAADKRILELTRQLALGK